jgi:hypothetical protein
MNVISGRLRLFSLVRRSACFLCLPFGNGIHISIESGIDLTRRCDARRDDLIAGSRRALRIASAISYSAAQSGSPNNGCSPADASAPGGGASLGRIRRLARLRALPTLRGIMAGSKFQALSDGITTRKDWISCAQRASLLAVVERHRRSRDRAPPAFAPGRGFGGDGARCRR